MKNQKDILNKLIPADDLYWDDYDNKYIALSKEEIDAVLIACVNDNIHDEQSMIEILQWCTSVRVGELLMKGFLAGKISILGLDKDGEPFFGEKSPDDLDHSD
jgi:hypothetical protein